MKSRILKSFKAILRFRVNKNNRKMLQNKDCSIISSNCVGGVISHELGLRFNSPTVNLFISPNDYIKFISDLQRYCEAELIEKHNHEKAYPVGQLDDITIYFMHYKSFEEAKIQWDRRKRRINYNNLFFIMIQRDGCTYEDIRRFDHLDYKNKVVFTREPMPEIKSAYFIEGTVVNGEVNDLCGYKSKLSGKRWIDNFDYVKFLNGDLE